MHSRVHPKYKTKYRVRNSAEYDRTLVQRGDITLWFSPDAEDTWTPGSSGKRGDQRKFSDQAIETALVLRLVFNLPLRQTEGFLRSVLSLMALDLEAHAHLGHGLPDRGLDRRSRFQRDPGGGTGHLRDPGRSGELDPRGALHGSDLEGAGSGYAALGSLYLLGLPALIHLGHAPGAAEVSRSEPLPLPRRELLLRLGIMILFGLGPGPTWAFMERLGVHIGLEVGRIGWILAVGFLCGSGGSLLADSG